MKNYLLLSAVVGLLITSCQKKADPFLVTPNSVGELTKTSTVKDLETIFANDSIVMFKDRTDFTGNPDEIEIFDKKGNQLLLLKIKEQMDSTATFKSIQLIDPRYKTDKGFSVSSTFKDLQDSYKISKITNTLSVAMITIPEINAYIAINKKELADSLLFDTNSKIEATQIPDTAKIKYFWLDWDKN